MDHLDLYLVYDIISLVINFYRLLMDKIQSLKKLYFSIWFTCRPPWNSSPMSSIWIISWCSWICWFLSGNYLKCSSDASVCSNYYLCAACSRSENGYSSSRADMLPNDDQNIELLKFKSWWKLRISMFLSLWPINRIDSNCCLNRDSRLSSWRWYASIQKISFKLLVTAII